MEDINAEKTRFSTPQHQLPTEQYSNYLGGLKVLGLVADNSACGYYRVINPLHMCKLHGADVSYSSFQGMGELFKYDIIIAPRQHSPEVHELLNMARWEGKLVIGELDDDLHAVLPTSPAFGTYHQGSPELRMVSEFFRMEHGFTTSTPEIAKWYYQFNRNSRVVENHIDFSFRDWGSHVQWIDGQPLIIPQPIEKAEDWKDRIVLAYSGGSTHQEDTPLIYGAIRRVLEKYENVYFALYMSEEDAARFLYEAKLPVDKIVRIQSRHFLDYPVGLKGFDIALAPLSCHQFNLAKSFLKPLEMGAVGAITIGSNVGPYARFNSRHPGAMALVGKPNHCYNGWEEAISYYVENPDALRQHKAEIRKLVIDQYSLEHNYKNWVQAWMSIRNEVMSGNVGAPELNLKPNQFKTYGQTGRNEECPCGSGKSYKSCCLDAFG